MPLESADTPAAGQSTEQSESAPALVESVWGGETRGSESPFGPLRHEGCGFALGESLLLSVLHLQNDNNGY